MLDHAEAKRRILEEVTPLPAEERPFSECLGAVLATALVAPHPMPRFDNSAVDGFAVRAVEVTSASATSPVSLQSLGYVPAGNPGDWELQPGQCVQVATGAPTPRGADAVVMKEDATLHEDGRVSIREAVRPRENMRYQGEDINTGEELFPEGTRIGAAQLSVLATMGFTQAPVTQTVRVGIVSTGSELLEVHETPGPGQIRESNRFMLEALIREEGALPEVVAKAPDEEAALRTLFLQALEADIALISGGVSVGEKDLTKRVLEELGVEPIFWKVRVKPGKPLFFGRRGRTLVFGLPGNPASSFVLFEEFVRPALRKLQGRRRLEEPMVSATLDADVVEQASRLQFLRGQLRFADGRYWVQPLPVQGSHSISSLVRGNCLIRIEPDSGVVPAGTEVPIRLLRNEI